MACSGYHIRSIIYFTGMLALLASSPDLPVSTPKRVSGISHGGAHHPCPSSSQLSLSGSPTLDSPSVTFGVCVRERCTLYGHALGMGVSGGIEDWMLT